MWAVSHRTSPVASTLRAGLICACAIALSGCGQTGPLRLPGEPVVHKHANPSAPEATPIVTPLATPSPKPVPSTPEQEP